MVLYCQQAMGKMLIEATVTSLVSNLPPPTLQNPSSTNDIVVRRQWTANTHKSIDRYTKHTSTNLIINTYLKLFSILFIRRLSEW